MMDKTRYVAVVLLLFFIAGCKETEKSSPKDLSGKENKPPDSSEDNDKDFFKVERFFDSRSATWYFLTRINHKNKSGNVIKLQHAHASKEIGETIRGFAQRLNCTLAFNASTQRVTDLGIKPQGVQIVNGKIIYDISTTAYTLAIKDDNVLLAYKPTVRAAEILKDGINNALTAFGPLIENYLPVSGDLLKLRDNYSEKNPRQVIAQFENKDIVFLSCGGRGFDGEGMKAEDIIRILQGLGVRFAYMLDGGGSTSTVVNGVLITKKIDSNGTEERLRPNCLYVK